MDSMDQNPGRNWGRDGAAGERDPRLRPPRERESGRRSRAAADPLDQRVDRWVTAGRQFVEGVSGSRPGGRRPASRGDDPRPPLRPRLDDLGRWVENRLDWLLDDGDDWREPWQEGEPAVPGPTPPGPSRSRRQGLEAVSRRGRAPAPVPGAPFSQEPAGEGTMATDEGEWPDDASFSLPRWQRPDRSDPREATASRESSSPGVPGSRPLPRSSRRRG